MSRLLGRRGALGLLAGLPLGAAGAARPARSRTTLAFAGAVTPEAAAILVAGPEDGRLAQWARLLGPALDRALPSGEPIRLATAGASDGVTGSNQFDARTAPDGNTLLLAPGTAALAWLAGDPRAHFEAANWVPVLAGMASVVVAGRVSTDRLGNGGGRVRVAAGTPVGPETGALLGIELMGAQPQPVFGLGTFAAAAEALGRGEADALCLAGPDVAGRLARLARFGARGLFSFGGLDETGAVARDPAFPDLPSLPELGRHAGGGEHAARLAEAWLAVATATRMSFGLMLPQLTPASMVALWRRAGSQAVTSPELASAASAEAVCPLAGPKAAAAVGAIAADAAALLEFRRWLELRLGYTPG